MALTDLKSNLAWYGKKKPRTNFIIDDDAKGFVPNKKDEPTKSDFIGIRLLGGPQEFAKPAAGKRRWRDASGTNGSVDQSSPPSVSGITTTGRKLPRRTPRRELVTDTCMEIAGKPER